MADYNGDEVIPRYNTWIRRESDQKFSIVTSPSIPTQISAFGEMLVAHFTPQAAWRFDYNINTRFVSTSGTMAGGQVSGSFSRAQLSTSTNVSGTAQIQTHNYLRYLPGMGGLVRFTSVFATGTSNSEQLIGIGDAQDALAFGYNGSSFGILRRRAGVDNWTSQSQWNGKPLSETIIPQNGNIYQIRFQWLGFGIIEFYIYDKGIQNFVLVHTILYPNTSSLTTILNPTLPIFARIRNLGNNTNLSMFTPSAVAGLEGSPSSTFTHPLNVSNSVDILKIISDTNNNHMLTIRNKTTFQGVSNRVPIQIASIFVSRSGAVGTSPSTTVHIYKNATTAGALSFSDVDSNNSPVDTSTTNTTITSTNAERTYAVSSNTTQLNLQESITVNPGESLSVGVTDSGGQSTDVIVTINWNELF